MQYLGNYMGVIPFKELRLEVKKLTSNFRLWIKKVKYQKGKKYNNRKMDQDPLEFLEYSTT